MKIKKYNTLPNEAKEIRTKVFIEEQGFKNEFDDLDFRINHLVMYDGKKPIGTCRFYLDKNKNIWIFGRLAVIKEYRGKHRGAELLKSAEKYILKESGKEIQLHSQCYAEKFYSRLGYEACSDIEYDEHCPHIWMKKILSNNT